MIAADPKLYRDRQVMTTTFEPNWYWAFKKMLSAEQVDQIRAVCETVEEEEALVVGKSAGSTSLRKNKVSFHDNQDLYALLRPALMQANQASGWNYDITAIEPVQYTVYHGDNNHFTWHTDTIIHDQTLSPNARGPLRGTIRKISCTIQLSDGSEYEGGDFELLSANQAHADEADPISLEPVNMADYREKGTALFFPSFTYHRVKPVTAGCRRSLVCWFRGPKWR